MPKINFKKISDNLYQFGSQKIIVIDEDNVIKIQNGEGVNGLRGTDKRREELAKVLE